MILEPREPARDALVVCVDDEPLVLAALRRTLRGEPYRVMTTSEPRQVLKWLDHDEVAVVIADQRMPRMTGAELLDEVRRRRPATRRVVLTAHPEMSLVLDRAREGIERLLTKPWDVEGLRRTIRDLVAQGRTGTSRAMPDSPIEDTQELVLRIDCTARTPAEVLAEIRPSLEGREAVSRGLVIYLRNLTGLAHSLRDLVERLVREVTLSEVRAFLVDSTGVATTLLDAGGEWAPLVVCGSGHAGRLHREVLVLENREGAAEFLAALLQSAGHGCRTASSGPQAVRLMKAGACDLALINLSLPAGMVRSMGHAIHRLVRRPEVIGLTTCPDLWDEEACRGLGIRRCLRMPYSIRGILQAVSGSPEDSRDPGRAAAGGGGVPVQPVGFFGHADVSGL